MSREGATGFFRVYRQQLHLGYFGQVAVRLEGRGVDGSRTAWRDDGHDVYCLQPGSGEFEVFVDAALEGAGDGLDLASRCGVETAPYCVGILHVPYRAVDSEVTSVRAAAALAVAEAFGVIDRMGLSFDERGGGSFGPGPEPRHVVGRWTAHIAEGIDDLGPLVAAVVRSPGVRPLPHAVRRARENETWVIDDIAVSLDLDASVLSFASVSDPSIVETVPLASVMEIMLARSSVEQGRPPRSAN